jgi:hypothetical protein
VKYYVKIDESKRLSYKQYDWTADKPDESIWLIGGTTKAQPIEHDETSTIIGGLKKQRNIHRLVFPDEIKNKVIGRIRKRGLT